MSPDTNITMVEALRLTRAGRLTEATAVLQRGLAGAGTAGGGSTAAQPSPAPGRSGARLVARRPADVRWRSGERCRRAGR